MENERVRKYMKGKDENCGAWRALFTVTKQEA